MKILVVGAGIYGATCARLLADSGHHVVVIERNDHVGGHCHTVWNAEAECFVHQHGPHIFHTNDVDVWNFVQQFCSMQRLDHRPKAVANGRLYSFPVNLLTVAQVYDCAPSPQEAAHLISRDCTPCEVPAASMEEWLLANVGHRLYRLFFKGYTTKQWGRSPKELPAEIVKRLPFRLDCNDSYFDHEYQGIPRRGYTAMVEAMLLGIELHFTSYSEEMADDYDFVIHTGAIDEALGYRFGPLEYRSLRFEHELVDVADYQGASVINYCDEAVPFTRITEHKHFIKGGRSQRTVITREFSQEWKPGMTPYYPVSTAENKERYAQYKAFAEENCGWLHFGGRLGLYRYMDMDVTIRAAMDFVEEVA
jgi:UDP-galactopyranose mutase